MVQTFWKYLAVVLKVKHTLTIQFGESIPGYLLKKQRKNIQYIHTETWIGKFIEESLFTIAPKLYLSKTVSKN